MEELVCHAFQILWSVITHECSTSRTIARASVTLRRKVNVHARTSKQILPSETLFLRSSTSIRQSLLKGIYRRTLSFSESQRKFTFEKKYLYQYYPSSRFVLVCYEGRLLIRGSVVVVAAKLLFVVTISYFRVRKYPTTFVYIYCHNFVCCIYSLE